jgi:threonine synthase
MTLTTLEGADTMAAAARTLKVPASYKLDVGTRKNVAFLSTALDVDKSTVIERAVKLLAEHHADDLRRYIDQATAAIDRGGDWALAEALTGVKRDVRYRGGRPRKRK